MAFSFIPSLRGPVSDPRVPRMATRVSLPAPPSEANWYADVQEWLELGNERVSNCVEAAAFHVILQQRSYLRPGDATLPTEEEAIASYAAITGYSPADPKSDKGSFVLGQEGLMQYWTTQGLLVGGARDRATAYMQVRHRNPVELRQAIHTFGAVMVGIHLPKSVVSGDGPPYLWDDPRGPSQGRHEILLVGYRVLENGYCTYDLVSWGRLLRCTEAFLLSTADEAVCVFDEASLDARGINAAGINRQILLADMQALRDASVV